MRRQFAKAFSLVEILIVVVLLGIIAAIVIPQFGDSPQRRAVLVEHYRHLQAIEGELALLRNDGESGLKARIAVVEQEVKDGDLVVKAMLEDIFTTPEELRAEVRKVYAKKELLEKLRTGDDPLGARIQALEREAETRRDLLRKFEAGLSEEVLEELRRQAASAPE